MKLSTKDELAFSWWDMIRSFVFLLDTKRKQYTLYTVLLLLVLTYDLVPTYIVGKIIDFFTHYTPGSSLKLFYSYVAFFTLTWGVVGFIRLTAKRKLSNIQSDVTYFTRVKGFERLMDFSIKWHDAENTGNKVQRIQNGTDALKQTQDVLSTGVWANLINIIGVIIAFAFLKPLFVLYCLVYIGIYVFIQSSFYRIMVEMTNENNILMEKAGGTYYEGLTNILTIKTLGVKDDFKKNIMNREELTRAFTIKRGTVSSNKWKAFQAMNAVAIGGILLLSGKSYIAGAISLGSIFMFYNYFQKLNGGVLESSNIVEKLISSKVGIARMMPIFVDESRAHQGNEPFPKEWQKISIENASFAYQRKNEVEGLPDVEALGLDALHLEIKKYEKIGVVGESGSGKSTFAKMLLGLYQFTNGRFKIGETNFSDITHEAVTSNIALVLQDSEMFNLSLKENITLMRKFDQELFQKAVLISQLGTVIEKMPAGIDTLIGEKGYRLSGGERQRIGIARAIYKDPQILVLDEATSSLDTKTEALIQKAFEMHLTKKTIVSIAHRITTLRNVDRIIVFSKGKLVEQGTFKELSKNKDSHFYHLSHALKTKREAPMVV